MKPQPVNIEWAQGQVPTAFGPMTVKWAQDIGTGMFHLEVAAPEGTGGEVWVPLSGGFAKALTPGPVFLRNDSGFAVYQVDPGTYEFESRPDTVAPTISGVASPAPNAAEWNNSDVSVSFTCADDVSGVASCGPDQTLSSEGAGQSVIGTAVDNAGNSASTTVDINLDKTPPSVEVTGVGDGATYKLGDVPAAGCTTIDSLSGVATNATVQVTGGNGLGVGMFTADCSGASDVAGNPGATASVSFIVDASLDTFNRANGRVGNNWTGLISTRFYRITSQKLDVQLGGPIVWKGSLGTTQEAFVTLNTIDSKSTSQGLLLKVQSGDTIPNSGAIAVVYDAKAKAVRVSTIRLGSGGAWTPYGNQPFTFANGDQLGARVLATGDVQVFKNGTLIFTVTLNATDKSFFNSKGGRIGLWTIAAPNALFDDFGGGTVAP